MKIPWLCTAFQIETLIKVSKLPFLHPYFWHKAASHPPTVRSGPGLSGGTWQDSRPPRFFPATLAWTRAMPMFKWKPRGHLSANSCRPVFMINNQVWLIEDKKYESVVGMKPMAMVHVLVRCTSSLFLGIFSFLINNLLSCVSCRKVPWHWNIRRKQCAWPWKRTTCFLLLVLSHTFHFMT